MSLPHASPPRLLTRLICSRFTRFAIASLRKKLHTSSSHSRSSIHSTRSEGSASEEITWGSCFAIDGERLLSSWERPEGFTRDAQLFQHVGARLDPREKEREGNVQRVVWGRATESNYC